MKRKRTLLNRGDNSMDNESNQSSGLTQEIDCMDIGSSTPKKRMKTSPMKGLLKIKSLSDDEMPVNGLLSSVMYSTPVSSQKVRREGQLGKLKSTRFVLPSYAEQHKKSSEHLRYIKLAVIILKWNLLFSVVLIFLFCYFRMIQQCLQLTHIQELMKLLQKC